MAFQASSSFLALLLFTTVLLATVTGRDIPKISNTPQDKKEPQWFIEPDGTVNIPGIGRVALPPQFWFTPQNPNTGSTGGAEAGAGTGGGSYVPGGDDTFVPNPGFEVPNPGSGGGVPNPAAAHP